MFDQFRNNVNKLIKKVTFTEISEKHLERFARELKAVLIKNEVAVTTAELVTDKLKNRLLHTETKRFTNPKPLIIRTLREILYEILSSPAPIDIFKQIEERKIAGNPLVVAFFGVNGVGKTLSIAKLGYLLKSRGYSVVFAASDTFRAGSIQQLQQHGEKLKIKVISQNYGSDAAAVAYDAVNHAIAKKLNVVLIDTAGRIETNTNLMAELQKVCRVVEPDLKIFVGDALTGNALISQTKLFNEKIGIDAIILNKLDAVAKGGATLSVIHVTKRPILFVGVGQKYRDLKEFIPEEIVNKMLP
ncbi:MAG: signal recognition particle-docking protein FtsY [Candidatus Heimdallarchaeaceae archaeon]